jgi:hypothetical protein
MRLLSVAASAVLTACTGLSWNTEVAETRAARTAMALSVIPGTTTDTAFTTRWGNPTQKVREGGQTEFIYRDMRNPPGPYLLQFGDSREYVIVTFQYGLATGVRTSDGIDCRGTFPPRPPGHGFSNPSTVRLVGSCAPLIATGAVPGGDAEGDAGGATSQAGGVPGVTADAYVPAGKDGK